MSNLGDFYWTSFVFCGTLCAALHYYAHHLKIANRIGSKTATDSTGQFAAFQRNYLIVYFLAMFGEWIQGPYLYQLYIWYGLSFYQIGLLFGCSLVSSIVGSIFIGSLADRIGRRRMCGWYCVCYIVGCLTIYWPFFSVLLVGRALTGFASTILYSVFEMWLVTEHNRRGFDPSLLNDTLSYASVGSGVVAVIASLVANQTVNNFGFSSPYGLAVLPLTVAMLIMRCTWEESYVVNTNDSIKRGSVFSSFKLSDIYRTDNVFSGMLALSQACFEFSLFVTTTLWTLALYTDKELAAEIASNTLPYSTSQHLGLVFAVMIVCVMIGSSLVKLVSSKNRLFWLPLHTHMLASGVLMGVSASYNNNNHNNNKIVVFGCLLLFYVYVGVYYTVYGVIKSEVFTEEARQSVTNAFRIPFLLAAGIVLLYTKQLSTTTVFFWCRNVNMIGLASYCAFVTYYQKTNGWNENGTLNFSSIVVDEKFSLIPKLELRPVSVSELKRNNNNVNV